METFIAYAQEVAFRYEVRNHKSWYSLSKRQRRKRVLDFLSYYEVY